MFKDAWRSCSKAKIVIVLSQKIVISININVIRENKMLSAIELQANFEIYAQSSKQLTCICKF